MVSVDKKMELIAQIRQENNFNTQTMRGREQLLYGGGHKPIETLDSKVTSQEFVQDFRISSFKIRFMLSCFCVLSIILLDKYEIDIIEKYFDLFLLHSSDTITLLENFKISTLF